MTELMGDISIYEDLILTELLEGKTREEIVAALESSNRIGYDEHFILRKLRECPLQKINSREIRCQNK